MQDGLDALSRRISQTDQAGVITNYEYDTLGRLIKVIDALSGETEFTYDSYGNKLTQTDAEGRVTKWTYDALGRVASRTLPLGQHETMRYDAVGNLIEHVDFKGQTTTHSYDVNDRLTESVYADLTETFAYDAFGNRTESTKTENGISSTWQYGYDNLNRLSSETQFVGTADEVTLAYQYDAAGNRTEVTETKGALTRITRYTYDVLNRLQTVQDADGNTTTYSYDAVGNRSAMTHANGTLVGYVYDDLNRLTDLSHQNSGGVTLKSYSYSLLPNGKRSKIEEANGRTSDYQYDDLYRLTSEAIFDPVNSSHNATYTYDKVGNRTFEEVNGVSTAYTYNDNDWLLQTGGTTYTHDANGNTESQTLDSVVTTYTYNAKNELIGSDEAGFATAYLYNVDGVRVGMGDASGQTRYTIDSNRAYAQVIAEHVDSSETVSYVYGDDLISQKRGTETSTYHTDGLGSTRALSDSSGVLTDEYDYDAFGEVLNQTGTTENDYLFTGEQFDATLDQYYLRARYYDQSIGRFTQMDTWQGSNSDPVTLHKYLYANVDPVNNIDPTGRFTMGGISVGMNGSAMMAGRAITGSAIRGYVNLAVRASIQSLKSTGRLAIKTARLCIRKKSNCKLNIPMLIVGNDNSAMAQHIFDAQTGRGSNSIGGTLTLNYKRSSRYASPTKRTWYRKSRECNGFARARAAIKYKTKFLDCDEYPMFSTYQGGPSRYPHIVSLRPLPSKENKSVGGLSSWLYKSFKFKDKKIFIVIASPEIPISAWVPAR